MVGALLTRTFVEDALPVACERHLHAVLGPAAIKIGVGRDELILGVHPECRGKLGPGLVWGSHIFDTRPNDGNEVGVGRLDVIVETLLGDRYPALFVIGLVVDYEVIHMMII